jgi:hypothetical protein
LKILPLILVMKISKNTKIKENKNTANCQFATLAIEPA